MGHKVHPMGFRIGVIRDWQSKWFTDRHYAEFLQEDLELRKAVQQRHAEGGISSVDIERQANQVTLTIRTARPGIVIGRGGQRVDETRRYLEKLTGKKVQLNIQEVHQPELDATLVAKNIADQMQRRVAFRRAMKQTLLRTMQAGAKGAKVQCGGRLGGAEIARRLKMHEGRVPLQTLRADIDYGFAEAHTVMGRIGVKVWIYKGDILPQPKTVEEAVEKVAVPALVTAKAVPVGTEAPAGVVPVAETVPAPEEAPAVETEKKPVRRVRARKAATPPAEAPPPSIEPETVVVPTAEAEKKPARRGRPRKTAESEAAKPSAETGAENALAGEVGESDATT
ncbi:MAG: 30S ribosomal protein S3 [Chloroflexi bacterium]|nr:30S ribosomal protein S3 [Chloroflexota bacterium]